MHNIWTVYNIMHERVKPYNGRVAEPENPENVANTIENRLEVSFPWICQHHQSKIPRNDARPE